MPGLAISLDQVAGLRQSRRAGDPDPVAASYIAEMAGADGILVHLRSDRRHIQERDLEVLRQTVTTSLHLVTAATVEAERVAATVKPATVTLVPERREEVVTEGGLDLLLSGAHLGRIVHSLQASRFSVTLLVDPELDQIRAAAKLEANAVQINTRHFAEAEGEAAQDRELMRLQESIRGANKLRLQVYAGLGLGYSTVAAVATIPHVSQIRVGHSVIARACLVGLDRAVREMKALLNG
jgi:pyridoxine 5-phosphate synthase